MQVDITPQSTAMFSPFSPTNERADTHTHPRHAHSLPPFPTGHGLFEKQIAGLYMGEVARRILLRLAERGALFGPSTPPGLLRHGAFGTRLLAAVDEDSSVDLRATAAALMEAFGIARATLEQLQAAKRVCELVAERSARLFAAAVAAVAARTMAAASGREGLEDMVFAVDGSVFEKYDKYRERVGRVVEEMHGREGAARIRLQLAQDGSVRGAAFMAAAAAHFQTTSSQ
jgi:hexokinase